MNEEELKKGCGKKISYPNYHLYCGDSNSLRQVLCVSCKLKLSTLQDFINSKEYADELEKQRFEGIDYGKQEAQKMFLEEIDKLQKKRFEYNSLSVNQFIEELKSKIGGEDEEGYQLAFDEEHSFMNIGRADNHKRPIWKEEQTSEEKQDE